MKANTVGHQKEVEGNKRTKGKKRGGRNNRETEKGQWMRRYERIYAVIKETTSESSNMQSVHNGQVLLKKKTRNLLVKA